MLKKRLKKIIKKFIPSFIDKRLKTHYKTAQVTYSLSFEYKGRLHNKKAIVTGGAGGLGSAICIRLAAEGAIVGIGGRNMQKINNLVTMIRGNGGKAIALNIDLNDSRSIEESIESFTTEYGMIDILINNAGGSAREKSKEYITQSFDTISSVIGTNLTGTMLCTHMTLQKFNPQGGSIINMSSVVGLQGKYGMTDYAASKAGIIGFTRSLALELGTKNIRVNAVSPGWCERTIFKKEQSHGNVNCMKKIGKPEDIAGLVAYLVSDEANYITGQNIIIDGGRSLGLWGDN